MKKTLVALAALASVSSFAQVTLTGVVDVGYQTVNLDLNSQSKFSGIATNGVSTTAFFFQGKEDLGGGLSTSFMAELDWTPSLSNLANQKSSTSSMNGVVYTGSPFNGEQFVALSGGFGSLKIGTPNSPMLDVNAASQPFGTALGGGYSSGFGRFGTGSSSGYSQYVGAEGSTGRIIRSEKAAVFTSPELVPGLKAQVEYSAGNANGGYTSNDNSIMGFALRYNNGPLNVLADTTKASAGNTAAAGSQSMKTAGMGSGVFAANSLPANASTTWNFAAANYTFGSNTVYVGMSTTKTDGTSVVGGMEDSKSTNIAYKYVTGNIDLLANYLTRKSNLTEAQAVDTTAAIGSYAATAKMLGLGLNYNLSKNSMIYYRYESIRGINANATTQTTANNGVVGIGSYGGAAGVKSMVGMRMAF